MSVPAQAVLLPAAIEERIRRHAEEGYPYEICGAILGRLDDRQGVWRVEAVVPAPNEHDDDRRRRYRVPPEFQLRVETEARAQGREVLGYYHSHPDHPARPSEYDRSHAWHGYLYMICAVREGRAEDLGSFALEEEGGAFRTLENREAGAGSDASPAPE
jgi:proteasome lid subunit RPN8/RPN11